MLTPKRMKGRDIDQWVDEYANAHENGINRACHTVGIPMIVLSLFLMPFGFLAPICLQIGAVLFMTGWLLQFVGHAFEGKPPEFLRDWRFLFVGLRWWWRKIRSKE